MFQHSTADALNVVHLSLNHHHGQRKQSSQTAETNNGSRMKSGEWDYIIVGAGSAGCALAYELAKSGRARVLLIESGGRNKSLAIKVPALIRSIDARCDWATLRNQIRAGAAKRSVGRAVTSSGAAAASTA
jgi:choline dehydrogenase-like flavoprotein